MNEKDNKIVMKVILVSLIVISIALFLYSITLEAEIKKQEELTFKSNSKLIEIENKLWDAEAEKLLRTQSGNFPNQPTTWSTEKYIGELKAVKAKLETAKKQDELEDLKKANEKK